RAGVASGPPLVGRVFAAPRECFEDPTVPKNVTCRLHHAAALPISGGAALRKDPRADGDVTSAAVACRCSARPFVRFEQIGRFAVLATATSVPGAGRQHRPGGGGLVRACVPPHFNGRNPYSRHKRSGAATTSGRSRISES